jgi:AcrR family transcriptional regulator
VKKLVQKSAETEDLRVRRTRKMLQEALIELTIEKGFAAVTVQDISERAMVNRSTFYRHYVDKYELLKQYLDEVYAMVSPDSDNTEKIDHKPGEPPPGLVNLLRHVQSLGDFYRVMLGQNGDQVFTQYFRQVIEKRFRFLISNYGTSDPNTPPLDMKLNYISCADVGVILWWLENDQPFTVEQLAMWLSQLTSASAALVFEKPDPAADS